LDLVGAVDDKEVSSQMNYWNERYREGGFEWGPNHTIVAEIARDMMEERGFKTVLDVGCGYGRDCIYLAKYGFDVMGVDPSVEGLHLARDWARKEGLNIGFSAVDINANDFDDCSYDVIIMFNTLHFMLERERGKAVSEIQRILRGGGVFIQAAFSQGERGYGRGTEVEKDTFEFKKGRPVHFFPEQELKAMFAHFSLLRLEETDIFEVHQSGDQHYHREWVMVAEKRGGGEEGPG
jgi:SAM-dependent methyltransferase